MRIHPTISMAVLLCSLGFYPLAFAADAPTLYDDFNDRVLDYEKWQVESSEHAGAMIVDNGTLKINREFYQGQGVQAILLGPDTIFDALEATIKVSSETGLDGYLQASRRFSADVIPLLDGCANGSTADNLITDYAYQNEVYAAAQQLVEDCINKGSVLE